MDGNFVTQSLEWFQTKFGVYIAPAYLVREYEAGVLLLFGKYKKNLRKGINWKLPWPIHEAHKCVTKPETIVAEVVVTTIDSKTLSIEAKGEYEIIDERKWLLGANDALSNVKDLFTGWVGDFAVDCSFDELIKKPVKTRIKNKLNEELLAYGVKFNRILFSKISHTVSISLSGFKSPEPLSQLML